MICTGLSGASEPDVKPASTCICEHELVSTGQQPNQAAKSRTRNNQLRNQLLSPNLVTAEFPCHGNRSASKRYGNRSARCKWVALLVAGSSAFKRANPPTQPRIKQHVSRQIRTMLVPNNWAACRQIYRVKLHCHKSCKKRKTVKYQAFSSSDQ